MMYYFWVTFEDGSHGTLVADNSESAKFKASDFVNTAQNPVVSCDRIPYPASPILDDSIECPPFCYTPEFCKGRSCCPKKPSCAE